MIIFIYGSDIYRSTLYLNKMVAKFKADRDPAGYNVVIIDAEKAASSAEIIAELSFAPFLAEKKMIVVKNILSSKLANVQQTIQKFLYDDKKKPDTTVAVFWEKDDTFKGVAAKKLFELFLTEKYKEHFPALEKNEAVEWLVTQVQTRGGAIERAAANFAVTAGGVDSFFLCNLADQLVAYRPKSPLTRTDVEKFLEEKDESTIFNLVDAIISGQTTSALTMMRQQYKNGEDAHYILSMLIRQFKIMVQIGDAVAHHPAMSSDQIAKELGLHAFVVKKTVPLVKKFSLADLKNKFSQMADFDIRTKTGRGDLETLLDIFVMRMAARD